MGMENASNQVALSGSGTLRLFAEILTLRLLAHILAIIRISALARMEAVLSHAADGLPAGRWISIREVARFVFGRWKIIHLNYQFGHFF